MLGTRSTMRLTQAFCLGLILWLFAAPQARAHSRQQAQRQTEQAQPDTTQAPLPAPIPASEVITRAEEATQRARRIGSRAAPDPAIRRLAAQLERLQQEQQSLLAQPGSEHPEQLTRRSLAELRQQWLAHRDRLDGWQKLLAARTQRLGDDQDTLRLMRSVWVTTRDTAAAEGYPQAAVDRIGSVLADIADADSLILTRLNSVLAVQGRVADQLGQAQEVLDRIENAVEAARLGLLTAQSPPIWSAIALPELRGSLGQVRLSLLVDAASLRRYVSDTSDSLLALVGLFVLLLGAMLFMRRRARIWVEEDPELRASTRFLDRPVSAALLVILLVFAATHEVPPQGAVNAIRIVALAPILRLLPVLVHPVGHRPLYWLIGVWLLDAVQASLPDGTGMQRVVLLIETAAALVILIRALRPGGRVAEAARESRLARFILNFSRLGLVTLSASLVANIFGFAALADLLTSATISSAVLVAVIYAAARVLTGLTSLSLRTNTARSLRSVRRNSQMLRDRVRGFVNLAAVVVWLLFTLHYFDLEQPILHGLRDILNASLDIGNVSISLGDIIAFVAAVWLATLASRFTRFVLEEDVFPRLYLPRGVPGAISKISHYIIVGLGILIAFTAAGIDISNLTLVVGALGVGIGFGLQNIVNNFVSGLVLIFERPVKVGDTIEVEPLIGTVRHIGIRASTVRTFEGAEVIVPNGDLISGRVVNWTLSDQQRRVDVNAGVAYGSDPNRVIEILLEAASQHPKVLKHPEPFVLFKGFGESSLDFTLRFWTPEFAEWLNVQSDVTLAVHDGLYAAEIEIPFPQRDLHLRSVDASISGEAVSEALTQRDESSGRIASGSPPPEAPSIRADTEDTDK